MHIITFKKFIYLPIGLNSLQKSDFPWFAFEFIRRSSNTVEPLANYGLTHVGIEVAGHLLGYNMRNKTCIAGPCRSACIPGPFRTREEMMMRVLQLAWRGVALTVLVALAGLAQAQPPRPTTFDDWVVSGPNVKIGRRPDGIF